MEVAAVDAMVEGERVEATAGAVLESTGIAQPEPFMAAAGVSRAFEMGTEAALGVILTPHRENISL